MNRVLFNSCRPLGRCENITAVYEAYKGDKFFFGGIKGLGGYVDVSRRQENVIVSDEFVFRKRPEQKVVMIAHGLTGGKLYGADQRQGMFASRRETCALVDWYVTSSEYGRRFASSAAGIPIERCIPLGMPRTDAYFGKEKGQGRTVLARARRSYLFAPTFRSRYDLPAPRIDWRKIDALLEDDECFVVKRHMNSGGSYTGYKLSKVIEAENSEPSTPYLIDCDVLCTDFSSIMFDVHLMGKPVVLTCDKNNPYLDSRGMYMEYPDEYSSRSLHAAGNEERFLEMVREAYENGPQEADIECREKVAGACDGHSAERVAEFARGLLEED